MSDIDTGGKWTPGPWNAGGICQTSGWVDIYSAQPNGLPIASTRHSNQEANARLISAAPAMAEALEQFVAHYPFGINSYLDDAVVAARAALKLTKGE